MKKKSFSLRKFLVALTATLLSIAAIGAFLLYGPITFFRDTLITSAMTTMSHSWIATDLFDSETIQEAMNRNYTVQAGNYTDAKQISVAARSVKDNSVSLPKYPLDGERIIDGVGFIKIIGRTYEGWVMKVYDPSRLRLVMSKDIGVKGEKTSAICKRVGGLCAINAGAFLDKGGNGSGGVPTGVVIVDGQRVKSHVTGKSHEIVGIDYQNRLVLENLTNKQLENSSLKYAVEFGPFLIVNGKPSTIKGNGGYGLAARTAIGQTKDGVLIIVAIDGRRVDCLGASMKDLEDVMTEYKCYNAANLDGGASTTVAYKGTVINRPSNHGGDPERDVPNAFVVMQSGMSNISAGNTGSNSQSY